MPTDPLTPRTSRLLALATTGLAVLAALGMLAAFALGIAREGTVRWPVLALAAMLFALPLLVRRLMR